MKKVYRTIPEYIAQFAPSQQMILNRLYEVIRKNAPEGTTETISYQMPTFRFNGNLMHFALYKNHLGLYAGASAISHFTDRLKMYKTSKGTVQLPLDKPLPEKLIKELLLFNVEALKAKKGPNWEKSYEKWNDAEELMEQILTKTTLEKTFKWGSDVYTYKGKNVVGWGGFKNFFSIWFYNGVFLKDPYHVLIAASEGKTKSLRQWRFTKVSDMEEDKILSYIQESVQTIEEGKEIKPEKREEKIPEGKLQENLTNNPALYQAFYTLTPGKRNEYILYIEEAKQEKTKIARLEKIIPLILEGKGLHDKYKKA